MTIVRFAVVAALVLAAAPAPVHAQSVEAEVLFREGKKLMKEGKIAEACDKLEASDRIEPSAGTELNLADCREKNHQLATAWATFGKAASAATRENAPKREAEARRREKLLESKLAHLTISVPAASQVNGLAVARNGVAVDPALWNQPIPVDTGEYEIVAQAPGHARWSKRITVEKDGDSASIEIPSLAGPAAPPVPEKPVVQAPVTPPPVPTHVAQAQTPGPEDQGEDNEQPEQPSRFTGMRKAALGVAALGVAGIVGGVVLGNQANDLESQSDKLCPTSMCADPQGIKLNSDARDKATFANVAFVVGGAAVAGAAVMWFVGAPKVAHEHVAVAPVIAPGQVGLSLGGRF